MPKRQTKIVKRKPAKVMVRQKKSSGVGLGEGRISGPIKAAMQGYMSSGGNPLMAAAAGAMKAADDFFGSSPKTSRSTGGPMAQSSVAVPANVGIITRGTTTGRQVIKQHGPETISLSGTHYCGSLDVISGLAYFTAGSSGTLDQSQILMTSTSSAFALACNSGSNSGNPAGDLTGFRQRYLCPDDCFLETMGRLYVKWRPNRFRLRYVPQCPTSTTGVLNLAYTPIASSVIDTVGTIDILGATPGSFAVMSQLPSFTSAPVWQQQSLDIDPIRNGICSALGSYLPIISGTTAVGGVAGEQDITATAFAGSVIFSSQGMTGTTTNGHFYLDYSVELCSHTSLQNRTFTYGLTLSNHQAWFSRMKQKYERFLLSHNLATREDLELESDSWSDIRPRPRSREEKKSSDRPSGTRPSSRASDL